jgi:hypothetical protein
MKTGGPLPTGEDDGDDGDEGKEDYEIFDYDV